MPVTDLHAALLRAAYRAGTESGRPTRLRRFCATLWRTEDNVRVMCSSSLAVHAHNAGRRMWAWCWRCWWR